MTTRNTQSNFSGANTPSEKANMVVQHPNVLANIQRLSSPSGKTVIEVPRGILDKSINVHKQLHDYINSVVDVALENYKDDVVLFEKELAKAILIKLFDGKIQFKNGSFNVQSVIDDRMRKELVKVFDEDPFDPNKEKNILAKHGVNVHPDPSQIFDGLDLTESFEGPKNPFNGAGEPSSKKPRRN